MENRVKVIAEQHLRISNGGVTFSVGDAGFGPTIRISSSNFGNVCNELTIYVQKDNLVELGKMFALAADSEFSPDYCCATVSSIATYGSGECTSG